MTQWLGFKRARIVDISAVPASVESNIGWTGLNRIKTLPIIDAAVSSGIGTAAAPVTVTVTPPKVVPASYAGMYGINLEQHAFCRLEVLTATGSVFWDSGPRNIMPSTVAWEDLDWGAENQWDGRLPRTVWVAGKPAIHVPFPPGLPSAYRWSLWGGAFQPDGSPASYYTLGYAAAGGGVDLTFAVGSGDEDDPSCVRTPIDGGGMAVDAGAWIQRNTINLSFLSPADVRRLWMLRRSVGGDLPVAWLPDVQDPAEAFLFGGLRRFASAATWLWATSSHHSHSMALEEFP